MIVSRGFSVVCAGVKGVYSVNRGLLEIMAVLLASSLLPPLPFVAANALGIGGTLKAMPAHFCVTEVGEDDPPCDNGKHAFVTLRREGATTREVCEKLARLFAIARVDDVGYAGLKDRHARVTQTFSLPRDSLPSELRGHLNGLDEIASRLRAAEDEMGWRVLGEPTWHRGKLKRGHLTGNHFEIVVSNTAVPPAAAVDRARAIAKELLFWPNYYGPQRFAGGSSVARGRDLVLDRLGVKYQPAIAAEDSGKPVDGDAPAAGGNGSGSRKRRRRRSPWVDALHVSAFQSALFNIYLAERLRRGAFDRLWCGDLVSFPSSASKPRLVKLPKAAAAWRAAQQADGGNEPRASSRAGAATKPAGIDASHTDDTTDGHAGATACTEGREGWAGMPDSDDGKWSVQDWSETPDAEDVAAFTEGTITFTGPMFGGGMASPQGHPAELERSVWEAHMGCALEPSRIRSSILTGSRRVGRLPLPADLTIDEYAEAEGVRFAFTLPSGSYATSLLREFIRDDETIDAVGALMRDEDGFKCEAEGLGAGDATGTEGC